MQDLTPEGLRAVEEIAKRNGVSTEAAAVVMRALAQGNGTQAQFNLPELGGMGQWSRGGMVMVGDMFNQGLKYRVDVLCNELAGLLARQALFTDVPSSSQSQGQGNGASLFASASDSHGSWWPAELGLPNSTGAQNELRYAWFPALHRLAIMREGKVRVYDTGDNLIAGFSQQQGGDQSLTFTSQRGLVRIADLTEVTPELRRAEGPSSAPLPVPPADDGIVTDQTAIESQVSAPRPVSAVSSDQIFTTLERLAVLRQKGVVTDEEFSAKKAELLARL